MNREIKRRMKREQKQAEKASARMQPAVPPQGQRRERVKFRQFLREIQGELRRVIWPTTQEVITYSLVVVVVVVVLVGVVFVLDLGFAKGVVELFKPVTRAQ